MTDNTMTLEQMLADMEDKLSHTWPSSRVAFEDSLRPWRDSLKAHLSRTVSMSTASDLVREALDYFYKSGDVGDREYVTAIRAHIAALEAYRARDVTSDNVERACAIYFGDLWPDDVEETELVRISMRAALEADRAGRGEAVPYCKKCGDGIIASDPGICGTCYDTDHVAAPDGGAEYDFYVAEDGDVFHVMNVTDNGLFVRWYRDDDRDWMDHADFAKARPIRTHSNAKAVDVESLIASCVPGGSVCDPQAVADNIREWFVGRSNAKAGEDAKDAEYGRALIVAMNCEYQHAKQMRGKKQEEWITIYALLHRLKSAADNLTDLSAQRGDASEMGVGS